jgi:hypothetical protein
MRMIATTHTFYQDDCEALVKREGLKVGGEVADIRRCIPIKAKWTDFDANEEKNKIFISGLDVEVDKPLLRKTFERVNNRGWSRAFDV